jgi:hypothetical protein
VGKANRDFKDLMYFSFDSCCLGDISASKAGGIGSASNGLNQNIDNDNLSKINKFGSSSGKTNSRHSKTEGKVQI